MLKRSSRHLKQAIVLFIIKDNPISDPVDIGVMSARVIQPVRVAPIRVHDIDIEIGLPLRKECDLAAIGGPGRVEIPIVICRKPCKFPSIYFDGADFRMLIPVAAHFLGKDERIRVTVQAQDLNLLRRAINRPDILRGQV